MGESVLCEILETQLKKDIVLLTLVLCQCVCVCVSLMRVRAQDIILYNPQPINRFMYVTIFTV
jgi:hypothetical protein